MPQYQSTPRYPSQSLPESFALPDNRYLEDDQAQGQPRGAGAYQPAMPMADAPADGLAHVEGLTDKYYETWGKLKSYANGMWKDYGVDVTAPDFSQKGGGTAFKTYQKLSAVMMNTANKLGNRMKEQTQMKPFQATGQVTGSGEQGDPYVSTHLAPEVEHGLKSAEETFYTAGDAKRAYDAHIAPKIAEIEARPDKDNPYWQHQLDVLKAAKTTFQTHPSYFKAVQDANEKNALKERAKATREMGTLKKATALKNGLWEKGSYTVDRDPSDPNKTVAFNAALAGRPFGSYVNEDGKNVSKIIDGFKRHGGNTYLVIKSSDGTPLPNNEKEIRVDNMNGADFTAMLQQANSSFGKAENMYAAVDILGKGNQEGGVEEPSLFESDYEPLLKNRASLDNEIGAGQAVTDKKNQIIQQLGDLGWGDSVNIGGLNVFNNKWGSGYSIDNAKGQHLTADDVVKLLQDKGYFEASPSTSSSPSNIAPPQPGSSPQGKTYNMQGHDYTREELKSAGWSDAQIDKLP